MNPVHSALLTAKRRRYEDGGALEAKASASAPAVEVARAATSAAADKAPAISEADIQNLYRTTKGIEREADATGLEYWKGKAANGMTLDQMQAEFNKAAQDPLEAAKSDTMKSTGAVASFGDNPPVPPTKPLYLQTFDYSKYDNPLDARYAYLSKTFNPTIAAAMMGNYAVESFNNPNQFQIKANGTPLFDKNNMPTGYGAAQWGGTRLTNPNAGQDKMGLFDFADKFGFDPNSTEGQDRFSVYELTQNPEYAGAYKDLLSAGTNINKATQIFGEQYESPKNLGASLADRQAKAGLYQNYYSNPSSLSAADQAAIAKTKTGMFDPAFQKYAADKAAAEKATQLAKTQTQTVTDPMVDTTGFNTGVDTSVNDQIMQQSNDYLNQSLQNNLNNNFVDPNNFSTGMGTYNTGMSFSSGNSAQGRGINEFGESNGLVIPGPGNNDFWPFAKGGAVGHALRIAHHYATGGHTPAQPNYEREIDRINRMLAEKAEVNPATQDWSARRNEYLQGRPGPQIRDRSFARGGYADGGGAESVLMQDKLNAPNQWLQFGGQDMDRAPTGLPIGQAVGTDVAYHTLEGLGHGAELTKRASEGEMLSMRDPETFEKVNSAAGVAMTGGIGGAPKGAVLGSGPVRKSLDDIVGGWENKGVKLDVSGGGEKPLGISRIVVPEDMRSQGIGSQVMNDLVAHADDANKMMTLTPSKDFGASSVDRLRNFYKQFGFVENKGKNKDYSISDTMYRKPTAVEPQIGLKQHEPEGYLAHDNPSRKQNFENWFGESVVKNQDGTPKTVYHGSGADFSVFRPSKTGEFGPGVYATDLADEASSYAGTHLEGTGQNVMPVHIRMEQPFVAKNPSDFWDAFGGKTDTDAMLNAQKAGYDGVIIERPYTIYDDKRKQFYQTGQTHTHYVVFDPKQIKSAIGNKGTYDLKSPKITEARGGAIPFGPEAAQRAVQIAKQQAGRR